MNIIDFFNSQPQSAPCYTESLPQDLSLEMMLIPSGTFLMGSPKNESDRFDDEIPQHLVTVPSFLMGKYPVTQAQWKAVATLPKVERDLDADPAYFKGDNHPVESVSWYDAVEFCARLSTATSREYRLPTESEWEYACRAGMATPFHFGKAISKKQANFNSSSTTRVGKYPPNNWGLYDMHGNVAEWCQDHWHDDYIGAPSDGSAWLKSNEGRRVLCGGSWFDGPGSCRSAFRDDYSPDFHEDYIGFRVVCCKVPLKGRLFPEHLA